MTALVLSGTSCKKDQPVLSSATYQIKKDLKTENVIVLIIDGPRYSETWGEPTKKYIPNIANYFASNGVIYTKFRNNGPTYTLAGHTAITTGIYQEINNGGQEIPENKSIFQAYLQATGLPKDKVWIVTSKSKLNVLSDCKDTDWKGKYNPSTDCGTGYNNRDDNATLEKAKEIFSQHHPKLALVQFREPDHSGHANDWDGYLKGIQNSDRLAMELWDFIQKDSVYAGKTTLLITNDHGRHTIGHLDGFASHGDDCEGCRNILLVGIGPDFKRNTFIDGPGEQVDLSPTIASMLNIKDFRSQGRVLEDLFEPKLQ